MMIEGPLEYLSSQFDECCELREDELLRLRKFNVNNEEVHQ
jgi:hypothetical protein